MTDLTSEQLTAMMQKQWAKKPRHNRVDLELTLEPTSALVLATVEFITQEKLDEEDAKRLAKAMLLAQTKDTIKPISAYSFRVR